MTDLATRPYGYPDLLNRLNVKLAAVRKLVDEAKRAGVVSAKEASRLNIRQNGIRLNNWLTKEQAKELLAVPDRSTLKGKRDYVTLAGCALRRNELAMLDVETIQLREGRWVLADLCGKRRRILTVAIPMWVEQGINAWTMAAGIENGRFLRRVTKAGKPTGDGSERLGVLVRRGTSGQENPHQALWSARSATHLRKNFASKAGGDLKQIKFLLGHSSIQTTERYLGSEQDIVVAVNDSLGL